MKYSKLPPNWCVKKQYDVHLRGSEVHEALCELTGISRSYWSFNSDGSFYGVVEKEHQHYLDNKHKLSFCTHIDAVKKVPGMMIFESLEEFENYLNGKADYEIF